MSMIGGMQGHTAQDGHAILMERIEAPLKERIAVLESALKKLKRLDEKYQKTLIGFEWNLSQDQLDVVVAALKKEKPNG
jgi:hypothetical protein